MHSGGRSLVALPAAGSSVDGVRVRWLSLGEPRPDTVVVRCLLRVFVGFVRVVIAVRGSGCSLLAARVGVWVCVVSWVQLLVPCRR
jgi:hypothetical protein